MDPLINAQRKQINGEDNQIEDFVDLGEKSTILVGEKVSFDQVVFKSPNWEDKLIKPNQLGWSTNKDEPLDQTRKPNRLFYMEKPNQWSTQT